MIPSNENSGASDNEIPESTNTKPMDSKKDVENANDEKINEDFPGYPHYPAKEDIMDQRTDSHRVDVDVENIPNTNNKTGVSQRFAPDTKNPVTAEKGEDDLGIRSGTEADVTGDDLAILNATNDEIGVPQNVDTEDINTDLDIPGSDLDDANEAIGEEDEENNYYSLGGDRHEAQEEDPYSGPVRGE